MRNLIKTKKNILVITIITFLSLGDGLAQITIGSNQEPEPFSSLQLDGNNGGLRLPQLENVDRNKLTLGSADIGLMIYNKENKYIEYWNGDKWVTVGDTITLVYNGINKQGNNIKLGGNLEESTFININNKNLNLAMGSSGSFSINDTVFLVNNRIVKLKPANISIKNDTYTINDNLLNINGDFSVTVGLDTFSVQNSHVSISGQLFYKDNNQGQNKYLVSNENGKAQWAILKPQMEIATGSLNASVNISNSTETPSTISSDLILSKGRWLIFANYLARTTSSGRAYLWTNLVESENTNAIYTIGSGVDTAGKSAIELVYFVDVVQDNTSYQLQAYTINSNTIVTDDNDNKFYAILIDRPLE